MTSNERRIRGGEVEGEIGAVADDGAGWLGGLPRDGNDTDVHGGGDTADNGRGKVGRGRGDPFDAEAVNVISFNGITGMEFEFPIQGGGTDDGRNCTREYAIVAGRVQSDGFAVGFGGAAYQNTDGGAGDPGGVEHGQLNKARRGIGRAIEQDGPSARPGEVTGDDECEILVDGRCVQPRILHDMAGADADQVVARQGLTEVDGFDVVEVVGGRRIGDGVVSRELVAAVEGAVGTDDLEVQVVYQGRDGAWESGDVRVGQGDLKRLAGVLNQAVMDIYLAVGQRGCLVHVLVVARGGAEVGHDDVGQGNATPAVIVFGNRTWPAVQFVQFVGRVDQRRFDQGGRRHRVCVHARVILHEYGSRAGGMRPGHAGATHVHVIAVNCRPGDGRFVRGGG